MGIRDIPRRITFCEGQPPSECTARRPCNGRAYLGGRRAGTVASIYYLYSSIGDLCINKLFKISVRRVHVARHCPWAITLNIINDNNTPMILTLATVMKDECWSLSSELETTRTRAPED